MPKLTDDEIDDVLRRGGLVRVATNGSDGFPLLEVNWSGQVDEDSEAKTPIGVQTRPTGFNDAAPLRLRSISTQLTKRMRIQKMPQRKPQYKTLARPRERAG